MFDRLESDVSHGIPVHVDDAGAITISEMHLSGADRQPTPERRFASIQVWLEGSGSQPTCWWLMVASWRPLSRTGRESL